MLSDIDKKNALWNSSIFVILQILGFVNYTLNIKTYGFDTLGLYLLIAAIFGLGASIDFGFGIATLKLLSEGLKKNDENFLKKIYNSFLVGYLILDITICAGFVLYYLFFFKYSNLFLNADLQSIKLLYLLLTLAFFFGYVGNYLRTVFEGFARYVVLGKINLVFSLLNTIMMLILYLFKLPLVYLAFFLFLLSFLSFVFLFVFITRTFDEIKLDLKYFDFNIIKRYSPYSLNIQASYFIGSFVDLTIKYIIGSLLDYRNVTFFETGKKLINLSNGLFLSAQKGLLNKLSEINIEGKLKDFIDNQLYYYSKIANSYSLFFYGVLNPMICLFILFWFGSYESMLIFVIFTLPYVLINFGAPLYCVMTIEGKGFRLSLIQLINVVLTGLILFFSIKLMNSYLGILGFYIAILINTCLVIYFVNKSFPFSIKLYLEKTDIVGVVKFMVLAITELILLYLYPSSLYIIFGVFLVIYSVVFYKHLKYIVYVFYNSLRKFRFANTRL